MAEAGPIIKAAIRVRIHILGYSAFFFLLGTKKYKNDPNGNRAIGQASVEREKIKGGHSFR